MAGNGDGRPYSRLPLASVAAEVKGIFSAFPLGTCRTPTLEYNAFHGISDRFFVATIVVARFSQAYYYCFEVVKSFFGTFVSGVIPGRCYKEPFDTEEFTGN
ncbi:hypothetical protein [Desulfomonile tiedjei]|uniref:Uncharacterized protein n=1 Tax=Desulfomonile tiedjei (strain ATCC 49306 / DSM 6799 / DCB-1) TaxID=706587 RepID=I4C1L5_DESTA|nr:hypothetical protein [Desulfomonile tiedjei]AFM23456.1 hypothetical protein Desti_0730 [Desulfomonile tiedjei DSM 6799]